MRIGNPEIKSSNPQISDLFNNPSPPAVGRRQLNPHPIADQHPDEVAVEAIGNVRRHQPAAIQLHAIQGGRQLFRDLPGQRA